MNSNKTKKNRGITLIALIITIIVMLILVAVTITMAVNGGLFEYAGRAGTETNTKRDEEQEFANLESDMTYDDLIEKYTGGKDNGETTGGEATPEKFSTIYEENETITQGDYTAVIPKGFAVGTSKGINTIADGLVITDAVDAEGNGTGNEFVWIPVTYTKTNTDTNNNNLDDGFEATFKRSNVDKSDYSEPYADGYSDGKGTEEAKDYYDMMLSVQKNKGFYIGRYEAGTTEERKSGVANGTDTVVIKRDAIPYTYVAWGKSMSDYENIIKYDFDNYEYSETGLDQGHGAVYLSKHLLDGKTTGATSTLCYGVQWDAMLNFIDDEYNINDSTEWGNYSNNDLTITRASAKYYANNKWNEVTEDGTSCGRLLTTGADDSFAAKNIFDVAGNVWEWTREAYSSFSRVTRGRCLRLRRRQQSCVLLRRRLHSVPLLRQPFFQARTLYNK